MSQALTPYEPIDISPLVSKDFRTTPFRVKLDVLRVGLKLRHGRPRRDHVAALVQSGGRWPPILISPDDHTIIDGRYRYLAARELGHSEITCIGFHGDPESAFLEAVRRNVTHGLPLSLRDRESAATRLLSCYPDWSDRRVAETCGLSPGTVRQLRVGSAPGRSGAQNGHLNTRIGRDGKRYPVDTKGTRARILAALRDAPDSSLRQIAEMTGSSPATVRTVKTLRSLSVAGSERGASPSKQAAMRLQRGGWVADSGLHSTAGGAAFADWFERTRLAKEWTDFVPDIPLSRIYEIADEARYRAEEWATFASVLENRVRR